MGREEIAAAANTGLFIVKSKHEQALSEAPKNERTQAGRSRRTDRPERVRRTSSDLRTQPKQEQQRPRFEYTAS